MAPASGHITYTALHEFTDFRSARSWLLNFAKFSRRRITLWLRCKKAYETYLSKSNVKPAGILICFNKYFSKTDY